MCKEGWGPNTLRCSCPCGWNWFTRTTFISRPPKGMEDGRQIPHITFILILLGKTSLHGWTSCKEDWEVCCVVGQPCMQLRCGDFYSKMKKWRISTAGQSVVSATVWAPAILYCPRKIIYINSWMPLLLEAIVLKR